MWRSRPYPTSGRPHRVQVDGEWGIGIPIRRPAGWLGALLLVLGFGLLAFIAVAVVRLLRGGVTHPGGVIAGILLALPFTAIFLAGGLSAFRLRSGPTRMLVVTPTRVLPARPGRPITWESLVDGQCRTAVTVGALGRGVDLLLGITSGEREVSIAKAGDLDVDPWQVARALRALAADPRLRPRLATDAGLALITEQPGQR